MRRRYVLWGPVLVAATLAMATLFSGQGPATTVAATLLQDTPTPVPTATPVPPAPTATFTPVPAATPIPGPDLTVNLFGSPDPVPSGSELTYSLLVSNVGTAPSAGTTVFISVPAGTAESSAGPNCSLSGGGVTCVIPPLGIGGTAGFTFDVNVTAAPGNVINAVAIVDPSSFMTELDKTNNTDTASIFVGAAIVGPTPTATPVPLETATPVVIVVTPTPVPAQPTPVSPAPTPAPSGQLWLRVLQPTQTYGQDDSPQWIAQPGEWYVVERQEGGWALAYWEGDSPAWSVWFQVDPRVEVSVQNRVIPGQALWLLILGPTQAYGQDDSPAWIAQPGEWYQVIQQDANWVLAFWEGDTPAGAVWIELDSRVDLQRT
jgi:hypothetical protein